MEISKEKLINSQIANDGVWFLFKENAYCKIGFMSTDRARDLLEKSKKRTWKNHQQEDAYDDDIFRREHYKHILFDWRGFDELSTAPISLIPTAKIGQEVSVTVDGKNIKGKVKDIKAGIVHILSPLPYSLEKALEFDENLPEFREFVSGVSRNAKNFIGEGAGDEIKN